MDYVQPLQHDDGHVNLMKFIKLVKPGIIFGNIVTLCGGFFVAVQGNFSWSVFLSALFGMAFIIASGCVLNNYIDRDIDQLMKRTQNRPSACGLVSLKFALSYAFILGAIGFAILLVGTNLLTIIIAAIGLFAYVVAYTLWFKRNSIFGTVIGAISGSIPPVIGYTAMTNHFDLVAVVLFVILFCWQIPHFFAIAIYRKDDYAAANIPVLPLKRSMLYTKVNILLFVLLYVLATFMLMIVATVHLLYCAVAIILGATWIMLSIQGFKMENHEQWARKMFLFSIISITLLSIFMAI
ncbi:heme o synthase [Fastidiosibacter lacustris]|uniref:heme o synthase n=1 Tax=Fastidiosibacter lacustris TaxID=2056695 RepID=UPI000E34B803|nr:heme o synthase [Fastidiosibacter lacustris]